MMEKEAGNNAVERMVRIRQVAGQAVIQSDVYAGPPSLRPGDI